MMRRYSMYHNTIEELKAKSLAPGVDIKALTGDKMSMVVFYIAPAIVGAYPPMSCTGATVWKKPSKCWNAERQTF